MGKKSRNLEDKISLLEDQMQVKSPVLVRGQCQTDYEMPERLDEKENSCIGELDGMMRKYRTDFLNRKYNATQ